jgi:phage gp29-like protein
MALAADPQPRRSPLAAPAQARRDALPMADDADSATKAPEAIAEAALPAARRALAPMFGPLQARLDALAGIADDAAFARELAALSDDLPAMLPEMDSQAFETALADAMRGSIVAGMAQRAAELKKKEGRR